MTLLLGLAAGLAVGRMWQRVVGETPTLLLDLDQTLWYFKDGDLSLRPGATMFVQEMQDVYGKDNVYVYTAAMTEFAREHLKTLMQSTGDPFDLFPWVFARVEEKLVEGQPTQHLTPAERQGIKFHAKDLNRIGAILEKHSRQYPEHAKTLLSNSSILIDDLWSNVDVFNKGRAFQVPVFLGDPSDQFLSKVLSPILNELHKRANVLVPLKRDDDEISIVHLVNKLLFKNIVTKTTLILLKGCPSVAELNMFRDTLDQLGEFEVAHLRNDIECPVCLNTLWCFEKETFNNDIKDWRSNILLLPPFEEEMRWNMLAMSIAEIVKATPMHLTIKALVYSDLIYPRYLRHLGSSALPTPLCKPYDAPHVEDPLLSDVLYHVAKFVQTPPACRPTTVTQ